MPRGIKGSGPAKPRKEQGPRAPVSRGNPAEAPAGAPVPAPQPPVPAEAAQAPAAAADGNHPTDVDRMSGEHLKAFAKKTGVIQRDIDGLSEDRLRQAIKLMLAERYEDD